MQPVTGLRMHRLENLERGVEPDQVEQRQRSHRKAATGPHGGVEVLPARESGAVHPHRGVEVAEQQGVRDEPGAVVDDDRRLAEPARQRRHGVHGVGVAHHGADHLDELQDGRRVEEVHAHDAIRSAGARGDRGDRQRRGVGGEHCVRPAHLVGGVEDGLLEVHPLGNRLDHEVDVGQVLHGGRERDEAVQRLPVCRAEPAATDRALGGPLEVPAAPLQRVLGRLDTDDAQPGLGEHLDDARAHRAEPDDARPAELQNHAGSLSGTTTGA